MIGDQIARLIALPSFYDHMAGPFFFKGHRIVRVVFEFFRKLCLDDVSKVIGFAAANLFPREDLFVTGFKAFLSTLRKPCEMFVKE
jgi:hypothetical protein